MARVDLNIIDRGTQGSKWVAENQGLIPQDLDSVLEQKSDNSGALNSLPTPFARFFVAREAFRRVMEECIDKKKEAGYAYQQLVSDILDVYELLFDLKYHKNVWQNKVKIELREWDKDSNLEIIKNKMPVLYNSIREYYDTDINLSKLHFLIYTENGKDYLLACTSPMTGFVTPPDMDKSQIKKDGVFSPVFAGEQYESLHIGRKNGGEYFRDILLFENRPEEFKNYMYNELFGSDTVDEKFKEIKEYILVFKNDNQIRNDYQLTLKEVQTDQNDALVINGLDIKSNDEIDVNSYFNPTLIKVPYRINDKLFTVNHYKKDVDNRDYDYLLPFKPEIFGLFPGKELDADLSINKYDVTVELRYQGKKYSRQYSLEPLNNQGRIIDLKNAKISFDLGLFPNILSSKEEENNYFKLLVVGADETPEAPNFSIDKINLSFFKVGDKVRQIKETEAHEADYGVLPAVVRSKQQKDNVDGGTKFYELFNSSFDIIEVEILDDKGKGLILPRWGKADNCQKSFTYAVDLGTSNTFMSRCQVGDDKAPELFKLERPMVSYLHEIPDDDQLPLNRRIENSIFEKAKSRIKTEFIPAIIDGKDYGFPIRTALCGIQNKKNRSKLFDTHNIAFFYEKMMAEEDQNVHTDIKWENDSDSIRVFIQEMLLMIKCDILQRNGDLNKTNLVWFRPLSFAGSIKSTFETIWKEEAKKILNINNDNIKCYSESEAPYYYFKKKNIIGDTEAVAVIDIGGGSTDIVYFKDNKPVMANSVHYGCDTLWSNGFNKFRNTKDDNDNANGIYNRYKDTLRFDRDDLVELNRCFMSVDNNSTKDIINFWLSNSNFCDINKNMAQDFKPVFVYHFTSILFYMAHLIKDCACIAPRTIIFSGNGSKYIDNFICDNENVLKKIVNLVLDDVFGGQNTVRLKLPAERKEATCYGGLYRDPDAEMVPEKVYHGDMSCDYCKVGDIKKNFETLVGKLNEKYKAFNEIYRRVLELLKSEGIIDKTSDLSKYVACAGEDMRTELNTYFTSEVEQKYSDDIDLFDSVFFLPFIQRVFEMTKL